MKTVTNDTHEKSSSGHLPLEEELALADTFPAVTSIRAAHQADVIAITTVAENGDEQSVSYAELDRSSRRIAALLQSSGALGERVLLLFPPGRDFIEAFLGCLYAGSIAVPVYLPRTLKAAEALQRIGEDCGARFALSTRQTREVLTETLEPLAFFQGLIWMATDRVAPGSEAFLRRLELPPRTIAFLQYTSGSTGNPKGVMVTHANLVHNSRVIARAFGFSPRDRFLSWLPPFHDMGLIGGILQPLFTGFPTHVYPPSWFVRRPRRWLQAISDHGITVSGAPNFAFELCTRSTRAHPSDRPLDLSSWKLAFVGAEPIRAQTLDAFVEMFGPFGFDRRAFYPCYGLAEATLLVTGSQRAQGWQSASFSRRAYEADAVEEMQSPTEPRLELVASGTVLPEVNVVIVDPATKRLLPSDRVGEIWISGASVAAGYFGKGEASEATFRARLEAGASESGTGQDGASELSSSTFLRSGDRGFFHSGNLYISGRIKDTLIVRGRNYYPQDFEETLEGAHAACRLGGCAVFAVSDENEERIVAVQELAAGHKDYEHLVAILTQAVAAAHGVRLGALILVKAGTLPKTTSGKLQRLETRARFTGGSLEALHAWHGPSPHEKEEHS